MMTEKAAIRPADLADKIESQINLCEALGLKDFRITLTPDAGRALAELLRLAEVIFERAGK